MLTLCLLLQVSCLAEDKAEKTWRRLPAEISASIYPSGQIDSLAVFLRPTETLNRERFIQDLFELGPRDRLGRRRIALTKWKLKWDFPGEEASSKDIAVKAELKVILPELSKPDSDVSELWPCVFDFIAEHEELHVRSLTESLKDFRAKLSKQEKWRAEQFRAEVKAFANQLRASDRDIDKRERGEFEAYVASLLDGNRSCEISMRTYLARIGRKALE